MATVASDFGSRHAPDLYVQCGDSSSFVGVRSSVVVPRSDPPPTEGDAREMAWLCSMVGCAMPASFAAAATAAAAAAATASSPAASLTSVSVPASPAAASASSLPLPSYLRVSLKDGRVYSGRLHCVDSQANLILAHASQLAGTIDSVDVGGFTLGQVLIAWRLVDKIEQQTNESEKTTTREGASK